ncbi:hypothetical protein Tco_0221543 [Tanacetum coccineum]
MSTLTFADTHNMVVFLDKPAESDGFHEIIDFLNANQIRYALTVNPTIHISCIQQLWATAKAKTVNGVRQIQALLDKKKLIITETSIRSDLYLEDAGGTDCLPTATFFKELARTRYEKPSQKLNFYKAFFSPQWKYLIHTITQYLSAKSTAWNEFSSTMASLIICLATNQRFNLSKYIFDAMVKHLDGGVKFLMYPRFLQVFINQQLGDMSHHKQIYVNPSYIKKILQSEEEGRIFWENNTFKKQSKRKQRKDTAVTQEERQQDDSVPTPSNDPPLSGEDSMQLSELMLLCTNLQKQILDLEKAKDAQAKEIADLKKRVQKRVESSEDKESFSDHEDASKQGRSIEDIDKDADVSLVDDTHGWSDDAEMFDINDLHGDEVNVDMPAGEKQEQRAQSSITKDKGKAIMIEPEVPLKRKDQVALDEDLPRNLKARLEAELIEEEKLARKQEEEANIALIES